MRKEFLILLLALTGLMSCSKSEFPCGDTNTEIDHHVSLEQALQELDMFMDSYHVETKAGEIRHKSHKYGKIETLSGSDLSMHTKSSNDDTLDDDLLYIVSLGGDGVAILSADDRTEDIVLAVMDSGSISVNDFYNANVFMTNSSTTEQEHDDALSEMGQMSIPGLLLSKIMISKSSGSEETFEATETKALSSATKYGPYTSTKWGQKEVNGTMVFNKYTPHNDPAGCVVIAVAQILMNTMNFTFTSNDGTICKRDTMMTVANYQNHLFAGTVNAQEQVAKFVHELGSSSLLCNVTYHSGGTSGTADGAKRALEAFLYSNVQKRTSFDSDNKTRATNQIRQGLPVYLGGCHKNSLSGHAWLLDGEWGDYYHINWGWNGMYDGYFAKGVFDPQNNRAATDSDIDNATQYYYTTQTVKPYTWTYRMVTYSL